MTDPFSPIRAQHAENEQALYWLERMCMDLMRQYWAAQEALQANAAHLPQECAMAVWGCENMAAFGRNFCDPCEQSHRRQWDQDQQSREDQRA